MFDSSILDSDSDSDPTSIQMNDLGSCSASCTETISELQAEIASLKANRAKSDLCNNCVSSACLQDQAAEELRKSAERLEAVQRDLTEAWAEVTELQSRAVKLEDQAQVDHANARAEIFELRAECMEHAIAARSARTAEQASRASLQAEVSEHSVQRAHAESTVLKLELAASQSSTHHLPQKLAAEQEPGDIPLPEQQPTQDIRKCLLSKLELASKQSPEKPAAARNQSADDVAARSQIQRGQPTVVFNWSFSCGAASAEAATDSASSTARARADTAPTCSSEVVAADGDGTLHRAWVNPGRQEIENVVIKHKALSREITRGMRWGIRSVTPPQKNGFEPIVKGHAANRDDSDSVGKESRAANNKLLDVERGKSDTDSAIVESQVAKFEGMIKDQKEREEMERTKSQARLEQELKEREQQETPQRGRRGSRGGSEQRTRQRSSDKEGQGEQSKASGSDSGGASPNGDAYATPKAHRFVNTTSPLSATVEKQVVDNMSLAFKSIGDQIPVIKCEENTLALRYDEFGEVGWLQQQMDLDPEWKEAVDPKTGNTYYWNKITQRTSWKRPTVMLPPGWQATKDAKTGKVYYWHVSTNRTSWKRPEDSNEACPDHGEDRLCYNAPARSASPIARKISGWLTEWLPRTTGSRSSSEGASPRKRTY